MFSFPVTWSTDGSWSVVTDIDLPDQTKEKIAACVKASITYLGHIV